MNSSLRRGCIVSVHELNIYRAPTLCEAGQEGLKRWSLPFIEDVYITLILIQTGYTPVGRHAALLESGVTCGGLSLGAPSLLTCQERWFQESQSRKRGQALAQVFEGIIVLLANASHTAKSRVTVGGDDRAWVQGGEAL